MRRKRGTNIVTQKNCLVLLTCNTHALTRINTTASVETVQVCSINVNVFSVREIEMLSRDRAAVHSTLIPH